MSVRTRREFSSRRFIKTVKQKKRFHRVDIRGESKHERENREREKVEGRGRDARLCRTLVTMGHFLGQTRPVHVGLVPVS